MGIEMEERKLKEIEHSKKRREVLQGFERLSLILLVEVVRTGYMQLPAVQIA